MTRRHRRRGTAPLEFALVLPLLFAMVYAGWYCVRCGLTKTAAAGDARRTTWEKRVDADPGTAFDLEQEPHVSTVAGEVVADVPGNNPFSARPVQAESASAMTDQPWHHAVFPIPELPQTRIAHHHDQLKHLGQFPPIKEFMTPHGHKLKGFSQMDLMANGRFNRHILPARLLHLLRRALLVVYDPSRAAMPLAVAKCQELAIEFPLAAAYYEGLAVIITAGIKPAKDMRPALRK